MPTLAQPCPACVARVRPEFRRAGAPTRATHAGGLQQMKTGTHAGLCLARPGVTGNRRFRTGVCHAKPASSRLGGWRGRLASAPKPTSVQYMRSHQGTKAQRVRHFPRWWAPAWRGICPDHTARRGGRLVRAVRRRHPEFQSFTIVPHTKARRHEVEAGALCALRGSVCVSCIAEFVTPWGV